MRMTKKLFFIFFKISIVSSLLGLVYIVYALNEKLDSYSIKNGEYTGDIKIEYSDNINPFINNKDNSSVQKFIDCFEESIEIEEFPIELKDKINEIYELFNDNNHNLYFSYEDLYTGLHISYNENENQFAASTIKAPVITYLYEKMDKGEINKDKQIQYLQNYFVEGSGSIQYSDFGTSYSIGELAKKSIVESDNIAYQMISYNLDYNEITSYWHNLGSDNFWQSSIWNNMNTKDGIIYMKELYRYYLTNTDNSNELINYFYNSVLPLIKSSKNVLVAHKSGWRANLVHDMSIIFDEYPYVVAIMTDLGYEDYQSFFDKASKLIEELHEIYWNNKSNYCYNKNFN